MMKKGPPDSKFYHQAQSNHQIENVSFWLWVVSCHQLWHHHICGGHICPLVANFPKNINHRISVYLYPASYQIYIHIGDWQCCHRWGILAGEEGDSDIYLQTSLRYSSKNQLPNISLYTNIQISIHIEDWQGWDQEGTHCRERRRQRWRWPERQMWQGRSHLSQSWWFSSSPKPVSIIIIMKRVTCSREESDFKRWGVETVALLQQTQLDASSHLKHPFIESRRKIIKP